MLIFSNSYFQLLVDIRFVNQRIQHIKNRMNVPQSWVDSDEFKFFSCKMKLIRKEQKKHKIKNLPDFLWREQRKRAKDWNW